MSTWAMLAVPWDEVEYVHYPLILQCKLNGIRAKWTGRELVTRQNKTWSTDSLPTLTAQLRAWSKMFPGIVLDGELYSHGCPFQVLEGICSVNRAAPAEQEDLIGFHAFDIISEEPSEKRQEKLSGIYANWVAISLVTEESQVMTKLYECFEAGFEGVMLRAIGCPYIPGRSEAIIKLKPWKFGRAEIIGFKEGKDKYTGMLGALHCRSGNITFNVSGGLSDKLRSEIWANKSLWLGHRFQYKCREYSLNGRPLQPQIAVL